MVTDARLTELVKRFGRDHAQAVVEVSSLRPTPEERE